ncbi:MAG: LysM peptidoglycan-binding domain-containing protein [Candidatus Limnocylindrales bacterium]
MASRGTLSDAGPSTCPFVALELDRDRRSERPDYRHRCYAEQVPAPRTIAHQERFCLSPNFSGCPIFQDWAVRAAARPVPLPPGHEGGRRATPDPRGRALAGAAATSMAASEMVAPASDPSVAPALEPQPQEVWPDSMATALPVVDAAAAAEGLAPEPIDEQQLAAFDAQPIDSVEPTPPVEASTLAAAAVTPPRAPMDRTPIPQTPGYEADPMDPDESDAAAVPAFLAGRSSRPPLSPKADEGVPREDVVPSWEIDGRFGAQAGGEPRGDGALTRLLTVVAVIIILALGVLAVILIPGLLSGSPQQTTRPSVLRTALPTTSLIAVVPTTSPLATLATPSPITQPTVAATPGPSPMPYTIKAGDTLARIARREGITVDDILAANPQISNPNDIQVGQRIVIPLPVATPAP